MKLPYDNLHDYLQQDSRPAPGPAFLEHLLKKLDEHIARKGRSLLLTLTKKSSEEVTNFLVSKGYKAYYLHSEIDTFNRREIIKKLKTGQIDIIVGVNLLREGIDLPEVSFIALLDADKEWFLRSTTSLIQIIWRAARNPESEVVLYADTMTEAMIKSLWETYRRRNIQDTYNKIHHIIPKKAISNVKNLESVKTDEELQASEVFTTTKTQKLKMATKKEKEIILKDLKAQLDDAIVLRDFEKATLIRDQIEVISEWTSEEIKKRQKNMKTPWNTL